MGKRYGDFLTIDNLADGLVWEWDKVTETKAILVYTKLSIEYDRALYQKNLDRIRERNRKMNELANRNNK